MEFLNAHRLKLMANNMASLLGLASKKFLSPRPLLNPHRAFTGTLSHGNFNSIPSHEPRLSALNP